jgi:hypothetical protein
MDTPTWKNRAQVAAVSVFEAELGNAVRKAKYSLKKDSKYRTIVLYGKNYH